mmetsp:Transcript_3703/g.5377  ORF Transcript_3703/g.5377 Transcript_3703/m.5377 type:complete len:212 (-) Transcript_3703:40-675(-)
MEAFSKKSSTTQKTQSTTMGLSKRRSKKSMFLRTTISVTTKSLSRTTSRMRRKNFLKKFCMKTRRCMKNTWTMRSMTTMHHSKKKLFWITTKNRLRKKYYSTMTKNRLKKKLFSTTTDLSKRNPYHRSQSIHTKTYYRTTSLTMGRALWKRPFSAVCIAASMERCIVLMNRLNLTPMTKMRETKAMNSTRNLHFLMKKLFTKLNLRTTATI